MKKVGKHQDEGNSAGLNLMVGVAKGSIAALAVNFVVLFLCSAAISAGWFDQSYMERAAVMSCVLSALLGSVIAVRRDRLLALPLGIGTGLFVFFLLTAVGIVLYKDAPALDKVPEILCACLCGGGIAGILGRKNKKKHRR